MTEKQQTAVQYLMEQLSHYNPEAHAELIVKGDYDEAINMEREQIVDIVDMAREGNFSNYDKLGYVDWAYTKEQITNTYQQP